MRAILLAAGEGARLRPFTLSKPKPMVRVANKPIAQYAIEALVENGVRDITLVVGYRRTKVQSYFGDGGRFGARLTYAFQEALVGTAHALTVAGEPDDDFLVVAADNLVQPSLLAELLSTGASSPAIVLHRAPNPSRYGVVETREDLVTRIVEAPQTPTGDWVSTGIYLFPRRFFKEIEGLVQDGRFTMPEVVGAMIEGGERIRAVRTSQAWSDAVYPWDLLRLHAEMLRGVEPPMDLPRSVHAEPPVLVGDGATLGPNVVLGAGTCIGRNVEIGAGTIIENSVIYDDACIGPASVLRNTIIGEGTRTGPRFTALSGQADVIGADGWHRLDDFGAIVGEDVVIGGSVTLLPGTIVGNRARIEHGRLVQRHVEENARVM